MDDFGIIFLTLSIICSVPVLLTIRRQISVIHISTSIDEYFRSMGPNSVQTLSAKELEDTLEKEYGKSQSVNLPDGKMISTSLFLQGSARDLLLKNDPFDILLDNEKSNFFTLATEGTNAPGPFLDTMKFDSDPENLKPPHINKSEMNTAGPLFNISGLRIGKLIVENGYDGYIHITNSNIRKICFQEQSAPKRPSMNIRNSWVNNIEFEQSSCNDFELFGGGIKNIICPPPYEENPFSGDVKFLNNTQLDFNGGSGAFGIHQSRRNMRAHLQSLENTDADRYMFAFEKRIERPKEPRLLRIASGAYDAFAFYGNSPGRSVGWLFWLFVFSVALIFSFDLTVVPEGCDKSQLNGWKENLCLNETKGRFYRALSFGTQSMVNPFGLFSGKSLVTAANMPTAIWSIFQSLFSLILITLTVLGLRRKFKTQ